MTPCKGCSSPAKCKKAGKCAMKGHERKESAKHEMAEKKGKGYKCGGMVHGKKK